MSLASKSESKNSKNRKEFNMNLLNEIDLAYCDTCGNYVPTVDEDGNLLCAYEYAEYPDIATVVG